MLQICPGYSLGNYPPQLVPRDLNIGETRVWRWFIIPWKWWLYDNSSRYRTHFLQGLEGDVVPGNEAVYSCIQTYYHIYHVRLFFQYIICIICIDLHNIYIYNIDIIYISVNRTFFKATNHKKKHNNKTKHPKEKKMNSCPAVHGSKLWTNLEDHVGQSHVVWLLAQTPTTFIGKRLGAV